MVPGRPSRRSLIRAAGAATLAALLPQERVAAARELGADERARLAHGEVIKVPLDLDLPRGDYFGGLAYALLSATPDEVMTVLTDPAAYASILPMTLECRVLGAPGKPGHDTRVFFRQGGKLGSASYVLVVRRESQGLLRFWMDPDEPHDIGDCWGYFRVQPWGRRSALLTYGALVHLDFGVVKMLFTETIRKYALSTPALVKAHVYGRQAGTRRG